MQGPFTTYDYTLISDDWCLEALRIRGPRVQRSEYNPSSILIKIGVNKLNLN